MRMLSEPMTVDFTGDDDFGYLGVRIFDLRDKVNIGLISDGGLGGPITAANASEAWREAGAGDWVRGWFYWCIGDDKDGAIPQVLSQSF